MANKLPKYPDLKYKYIRGLLALERSQRHMHFMKSAAEWTSKAIVSLELHSEPIKSVTQATQLEGIGSQVGQKLKGMEKEDRFSADPPPDGKFLTAGPALLIGLLHETREMRSRISDGTSPSKGKLKVGVVPEEIVVQRARDLCQERFKDPKLEPGFCPALGRMQSLITRGCVKKRTLKKQPAYELLPFGEHLALSLTGKTKTPPTTPSKLKKVSPRKELANVNQNLDALYTNDVMTNGLILLVDTQEWGGDRVGLGRLARLFGQSGVTYRTKRLSHGDYQWIWRLNNKEWTMPLLVERKRADDLAHSMVDGRFHNQIENMKRWRHQFSDCGVHAEASLKYLVEGDPEQYVVKCMDGCRGVGKCGNPSPEVLQGVIEDLDRGRDVDVIRTEHMQGSVDILVNITAELKHRISLGEFDELFATAPCRDIGDENNVFSARGMAYGQPTAKRANAAVGKPPPTHPRNLHENCLPLNQKPARKHQTQPANADIAKNEGMLSASRTPPRKRLKHSHSVNVRVDIETEYPDANYSKSHDSPCSISISVSPVSDSGAHSGLFRDFALDADEKDSTGIIKKTHMPVVGNMHAAIPRVLVSETNSEEADLETSSSDSDEPVEIPESDYVDNDPLPCQSRYSDRHDDYLPDLGMPDSDYDLGEERDGVISQPRSSVASGGCFRLGGCSGQENEEDPKISCMKRGSKSKSAFVNSPNAGKIYLMRRKRSRSDSCSSSEKFDIGDNQEHFPCQNIDGGTKLALPESETMLGHDKISQIKAVLPQVSETLIKKKLRLYGGDVESAIIALLEQGDNVTSSNDFEVVDLT